ncbi:MAG: ATP-NAD kinase family protein [Ruminococcaceae bacterium]|nr:ATP-NAD kinase family protein [Oscillospiraceae bacterium]
MRKLGLIINPIAGMGGQVGLKGTDGTEILKQAISLGAIPSATQKAERCLRLLVLESDICWLTAEGAMGEDLLRTFGQSPHILYPIDRKETTAADTQRTAELMKDAGVELILFAGGDGTARNIVAVVGTDVPVIGIPAGVKICSPVFGKTPEATGQLLNRWLKRTEPQTILREVLDLDEALVRQDRIETDLFGYLRVPAEPDYVQNRKAPTPLSERDSQMAIALDILDELPKDYLCIVGPGSTTSALLQMLGLPMTLMGVDVIKNGELIAKDCAEADLLRLLETNPAWLVLTPTGGQGYLLGRGNQQISAKVLKRLTVADLKIVATQEKLISLESRPLLIDTGDADVDNYYSGYYRAKTGYHNEMMVKVKGPLNR